MCILLIFTNLISIKSLLKLGDGINNSPLLTKVKQPLVCNHSQTPCKVCVIHIIVRHLDVATKTQYIKSISCIKNDKSISPPMSGTRVDACERH